MTGCRSSRAPELERTELGAQLTAGGFFRACRCGGAGQADTPERGKKFILAHRENPTGFTAHRESLSLSGIESEPIYAALPNVT
jgi:hypothetical protein